MDAKRKALLTATCLLGSLGNLPFGGPGPAEKIVLPKNIIPGGREKALGLAEEKRKRRAQRRRPKEER